jgi:hypothetical protein
LIYFIQSQTATTTTTTNFYNGSTTTTITTKTTHFFLLLYLSFIWVLNDYDLASSSSLNFLFNITLANPNASAICLFLGSNWAAFANDSIAGA